jgi:hypothetical protein
MKICLSYSVDSNYIDYARRSISSLNKTSPGVYAYLDLINSESNDFSDLQNIILAHSFTDIKDETITIKNKSSHIAKERLVKLTGAYANLKKVCNIYKLLTEYDFDYVGNMDADNLITKNLNDFFETIKDVDADMFLKFSHKGILAGEELTKRKNNFKSFDLSLINLETQDRHFREGCMIIKNTPISRKFYKIISENILNKIAWYGDSFWIAYAYKSLKEELKISELPNAFVAYDIKTELDPYVVSGYDGNKHSKEYFDAIKRLNE